MKQKLFLTKCAQFFKQVTTAIEATLKTFFEFKFGHLKNKQGNSILLLLSDSQYNFKLCDKIYKILDKIQIQSARWLSTRSGIFSFAESFILACCLFSRSKKWGSPSSSGRCKRLQKKYRVFVIGFAVAMASHRVKIMSASFFSNYWCFIGYHNIAVKWNSAVDTILVTRPSLVWITLSFLTAKAKSQDAKLTRMTISGAISVVSGRPY